jgi:hypothetical protein
VFCWELSCFQNTRRYERIVPIVEYTEARQSSVCCIVISELDTGSGSRKGEIQVYRPTLPSHVAASDGVREMLFFFIFLPKRDKR